MAVTPGWVRPEPLERLEQAVDLGRRDDMPGVGLFNNSRSPRLPACCAVRLQQTARRTAQLDLGGAGSVPGRIRTRDRCLEGTVEGWQFVAVLLLGR